MKWQAVFFDFDGVILDAVDVKAKAFYDMFRPFGEEIASRVYDYHLSHGGMSRFDKIRYWYENFLNQPVNEEEVRELCSQFSSLVLKQVIASRFVDGALESLKYAQNQGIPAYVVTGTPQDEICQIVEAVGIAGYFDEIHGSPRRKDEIVEDVLDRKGYIPSKCLFIGDGPNDYQAALAAGVQFLGIVNTGSKFSFPAGTRVSSEVYL